MTVCCTHASRPPELKGRTLCQLGKYGGRPTSSLCQACKDRNAPGIRLKEPLHIERAKIAASICLNCPEYGGPFGQSTIKIKCNSAKCKECGVSLVMGMCPLGKWDQPLRQIYREMFAQAAEQAGTQKCEPSSTRGIVIAGGGKYFASAYVTIRVLRHVGCQLPIELWYLSGEMTREEVESLEGLDVTHAAAGPVGGWPLKPYSVIRSKFQEVLFLDADSYPIRDPSFLFDEPEYQKNGAIFWPDQEKFDLRHDQWEAVGLPYRDEPDIESGQFVIDKSKWFSGLWLTNWMNRHADYYYRIVWGDKSTWHLAARALGMQYAMPLKRWAGSHGTMIQHDLQGKPLFNHRSRDKFSLKHGKAGLAEFETTGQLMNGQIFNGELELEREAHRFLAELREMLRP